jgi:hypothetical protein
MNIVSFVARCVACMGRKHSECWLENLLGRSTVLGRLKGIVLKVTSIGRDTEIIKDIEPV